MVDEVPGHPREREEQPGHQRQAPALATPPCPARRQHDQREPGNDQQDSEDHTGRSHSSMLARVPFRQHACRWTRSRTAPRRSVSFEWQITPAISGNRSGQCFLSGRAECVMIRGFVAPAGGAGLHLSCRSELRGVPLRRHSAQGFARAGCSCAAAADDLPYLPKAVQAGRRRGCGGRPRWERRPGLGRRLPADMRVPGK